VLIIALLYWKAFDHYHITSFIKKKKNFDGVNKVGKLYLREPCLFVVKTEVE